MLTNQEIQQIILAIYNPNTSYETRKVAENKLEYFQNLDDSWKLHLDLIISSDIDGHMLFMLCFGLNKILWKKWTYLSESEHEYITSIVIKLLIEQFASLPLYTRSKVEQIIATLCKNYVSYDVGFKIVNMSSHSPIISISVFRTILEESLSNDARLSPDKRTKLSKDAYEIAPQLVLLACNACVTAISSREYHIVTASLQLLKIIISKVQIGSHVNNETLSLLFNIAELASTSSDFNDASLNAVETLSEFIYKRYIPPPPASPTLQSQSSTIVNQAAKEAVANVLVELVSKAVDLIRKYCSIQDADESPIILALLQFISAFAECHLERCIAAGSSSPGGEAILSQITLLLRELAVLSCLSAEPTYLLKIAEMWETLLGLETLKSQLLEVESVSVCTPVLVYLVNNCSIQNNLLLFELLDDLVDDFVIENFADSQIRNLVSCCSASDENNNNNRNSNNSSKSSLVSSSSKEKMGGAEENMCVGTSLRAISKICIGEFVGSPDAFSWFSQNLPLLMQQSLQVLSSGASGNKRKQTAAALDICFYVNLLPLCTPSIELFTLLTPLVHQLVESRIYAQGKAYIGVIVSCIQVIGQIIQSFGHALQAKVTSQHNVTALNATANTVLTNITHVFKSVELSCDTRVTPSPYPIMTNCCSFLLQTITALITRLNDPTCNELKQNIIDSFHSSLHPQLFNLPIEIHAILICISDQLSHETSESYSQELYNLTGSICSNQDSVTAFAESNHMLLLGRYCASLDALARYYASMSTPGERQRFIVSVSLLQQCVAPLMNTCILVLTHTSNSASTGSTSAFTPASSVSKFSSVLHICTLVLSLTCSLQQSLGKKTFGTSSLQIFQSCVTFLSSPNGGAVMMNTSGLLFLKGLIALSNSVALTSSASDNTVEFQVTLTDQLLSFICKYLTDPHICAELLSETLKAGTIAIGCYWKSSVVIKSSTSATGDVLSQQQQQPACYPIAILITQLFVGSMNASISPADAAIAIDGMSQLHEKHNLFSVPWYQISGSWMNILKACLQALIVISHPSLVESLVELLTKLQKSDLSHMQELPLSQGFWTVLGNETYRIATEMGVDGTLISYYFNEVMLRYPGFQHLDMASFISYVLNPISADIAKLKTA